MGSCCMVILTAAVSPKKLELLRTVYATGVAVKVGLGLLP